jgi:integrase
MSLDAARTAAGRLADSGIVGPPVTLGQVREQYLDSPEFAALAPRTQRSYKHVLGHRDLYALMGRKLRELARLDLLNVKDAITREGRVASNLLRPVMALCSWAVDRGFIEVSPASRLKLAANEADPRPFSDHEVGEVVAALEKMPEPMRTLGLLIAYTGQRPATWTDAKWSECDLRRARLTVSRSRGRQTKLGRGWAIPIPTQALALLKELRKKQGRHATEYVFGRPIVIEQKQRDRLAKLAGMDDAGNRASLHRFRSTFLSTLNQWGVPVETQLMLAGHASPLAGSRSHYVVPIPSKEQVEVSQRWADRVQYLFILGADPE